MSNEININQLKKDIENVMRKAFGDEKGVCHNVASDFSQKELDEYIDTYYEYLLK